jgi:hypothetical protein
MDDEQASRSPLLNENDETFYCTVLPVAQIASVTVGPKSGKQREQRFSAPGFLCWLYGEWLGPVLAARDRPASFP